MTNEEFNVAKSEIVTMISNLHLRGVRVTPIYELLSPVLSLPAKVTWIALEEHFQQKQYSTVEAALLKQAHKLLRDKIISLIMYSDKLIKILDVELNTFDNLLAFFQSKIHNTITSFTIKQLLESKATKTIKFRTDISSELESYSFKDIVEDDLRIHIEDRVTKTLQREFKDIYGVKSVQFRAFNHIIFDKKNKKLFLAVDLATIIKTAVINKNMANFAVSIKSSVNGLNYPPYSQNLFAKLKEFYNNEPYPDGYVDKLYFKTPDGMVYRSIANQEFSDARLSKYHQSGEAAIKKKLSIYRILKGSNTKRKTAYTIELVSSPSMTTKQNPFLYEAILKATNKEDYAEALRKLL